MTNIRAISILFVLFMAASCSVTKKTFEYPLNTENQQKIYDICNYSKTFGQLDTKVQTDSPYHLYLQSGFYERDHFSLALTANDRGDSSSFRISMRASKGKSFVRGVSKRQKKEFLNEIFVAIRGNVVDTATTETATTTDEQK